MLLSEFTVLLDRDVYEFLFGIKKSQPNRAKVTVLSEVKSLGITDMVIQANGKIIAVDADTLYGEPFGFVKTLPSKKELKAIGVNELDNPR